MNAPSPARRWLGLIAVSLGVALLVADTTIVNVIVPSLITDLGITSAQAQWIQESYAIVIAALLLLTGRFADLFGARRVFLAGVAVFGATSVLAGLAPSGDVLILARLLQGVGAAMILPTSLALVNATFTGRERGQAFAVWGSTIGAAAAIGPLLGGALAEVSWRWAFGINIPLGVLILAVVTAFLAPSPRTGARIDVAGAVLSVFGFGLLAFALIEGRTYGWLVSTQPMNIAGLSWDGGPSPVLVALLVAAVALIAFIRRQATLSRGDTGAPLIDVRLFSVASFRNGNIATLIIGLGEFGIVAVLPLWLQFTLEYSALQAGLALVPLAAGSFLASGASFGMAAKLTPLGLVRLGLVLEITGLAGLALIATTDGSWWPIALALLLYGAGVGFATAQVTNVVLADVPGRSAGQASGIQSAARQLGSALGIAVLTTLFFSVLDTKLSQILAATGMPTTQSGRFTDTVTDSAGAVITSLAADPQTAVVADAARVAMTEGITFAGYLAAGLLLLGLIATVSIPAAAPSSAEPARP
ncbi:EmrB/QacA subfamily drug resistance transporter [Streptosporangium album]|uniref:EmrB/QacA subfamily drug resistance transporter n=1 Tax=Streptosporangium album TaxID=47479 RepID=A0A7W7WDE9_9ACTN|nr:DHA2 family efflux MFS transporter permease subunit [Streptosporangium album]MBB4943051.1 EmrB/QacA subfamily drug resistance transporter [Streptosporangium album]